MVELKKMFKKLLKKIGKTENNNNPRKIDQAVEKTTETLDSQFALISKREIAAWKAYLIIFFVAGFFASLIWSAYNRWYIELKAGTVVLSVVTDTDSRKAGAQYTDHILLDTGGQAIVAVQAIAKYDKTKVQIVSIDDTISDFPNEIKKTDDSGNGQIFIAVAKPTPGVNSASAKVADVTVKALADFTGSALTPKFDSPAAVDDSAAILDDGKGTNALTQVKNVVTTPTPPPPPSDTTPPAISNGSPTGSLTAGTTSAALKVTTNENATCKYGTTANTAFDSIANTFSTTGSTSHSTSVSGIADGKTYNYYVRCKDTAGNVNTSDYAITFSVGSGSATGTPPVISKVNVSRTSTTATITWKTNNPATSRIEYGTSTAYGKQTDLDSNLTTTHSVQISGLNAGTVYHYRIRTADASSNEKVSRDYTVTTLQLISQIQMSSRTSTGATITWKTNQPATSQVEYGTSTAYGNQTDLDSNLATTHSVQLSGLNANTAYHYRVKSTAASSNENVSKDYTFRTLSSGTSTSGDTTAPKMSGPSPSGSLAADTTSATISVKTDEAATCRYGTNSLPYGSLSNTFSKTGGTDHSSTVSVASGNSYKYYVRCQDAAGNATSGFLLIMFSVQ